MLPQPASTSCDSTQYTGRILRGDLYVIMSLLVLIYLASRRSVHLQSRKIFYISRCTMATIQKFSGLQYPNAKDPLLQQAWRNNNYQYATSSHQVDHDMNPGLIVQPNNEKDIIAAVQYAKQEKLAVAIASGGHQYSGACSTSGKNILVDLKKTFLDSKQDLRILGKEEVGVLVKRVIQDPQIQQEKSAKTFVYASVSWSLGSFNGFLKQNKCFVPHGQCIDVRVGGHAQTGGYGQLGRSFGLLGDHVWEIRLIDHDAEIKVVDKASDPELFHAILGGSPGNFGVITHYTMEVHREYLCGG